MCLLIHCVQVMTGVYVLVYVSINPLCIGNDWCVCVSVCIYFKYVLYYDIFICVRVCLV